MKFCTTRWVENVKPAQRALNIKENIQKYVKNSKLPNNFTVNSVKDAVLMPVKISFFQHVVSIVEPFLKFFQSEKPLSSISRVGENDIFPSGKVHQAKSTCSKQICI